MSWWRRGVQRAEFGIVAQRLGVLGAAGADPADRAGDEAGPGGGVRALRGHDGFDPGHRGAVVLGVVALLAALGGAWYFVAARPSALPPGGGAAPRASSSAPVALSPGAPAADAAASEPAGGGVGSGWPGTGAPATPDGEPVVVDVVGKVVAPGVVTLSPGARVHDAIAAAGGALPGTDLTPLDLASKLIDGEEIFVGVSPPSGSGAAGGVVMGADPGTAGSAGGGSVPGPIDLNTATESQLEALPGVGPVLAGNILAWRAAHGRFTSTTQLQEVSGIGPAKYASLAGRVRV